MTEAKTVLVTGATGQQGGAVAESLLRRGLKVRALTRNAAKAERLKKLGAEVVTGELTERASLDAALEGIKKVYLVTTPFETGMEAEVQQGTNMVDAALNAGVDHLVFSSVNGADRRSGIPHFETKWQIEEDIRKTGVPATIIRPVFFMDNFYSPWYLPAIQQGKLVLPIDEDLSMQMISVHDIGEFAAEAFVREEEFLGKTIDIAGDELTLSEAMRVLSEFLGTSIGYERLRDEKAEETYGHDMALMFRWFHDVGFNVDIPALEQQWRIPLTKYRDFLGTKKVVERFRAAFPELRELKTSS